MSEIKRELKRCPICGSLPRYWQWNHGAIVECWCKDHRIQCEGKTLEQAIEAWERRADVEELVRCKDCRQWNFVCEGDFGYQYGECRFDKWLDSCGIGKETTADDYCSYGERKHG